MPVRFKVLGGGLVSRAHIPIDLSVFSRTSWARLPGWKWRGLGCSCSVADLQTLFATDLTSGNWGAAGKPIAFPRSMTHNTVSNQRSLPDTEICRTTYIAPADVSQCLVENPDACEFAIRFGSG